MNCFRRKFGRVPADMIKEDQLREAEVKLAQWLENQERCEAEVALYTARIARLKQKEKSK